MRTDAVTPGKMGPTSPTPLAPYFSLSCRMRIGSGSSGSRPRMRRSRTLSPA